MTRSALFLRSSLRFGTLHIPSQLELATLSDARNTRLRNRRSYATGVFMLLTAVLTAIPWAAADTWDNNFPDGFGTGRWAFDSHWQDNTVPTINDPAIFPAGFPNGASAIQLGIGHVAASLTLNDSYTFRTFFWGVGQRLATR